MSRECLGDEHVHENSSTKGSMNSRNLIQCALFPSKTHSDELRGILLLPFESILIVTQENRPHAGPRGNSNVRVACSSCSFRLFIWLSCLGCLCQNGFDTTNNKFPKLFAMSLLSGLNPTSQAPSQHARVSADTSDTSCNATAWDQQTQNMSCGF